MSEAALAPPGSVFHLYASTRAQTESLCEPLEAEDFVIQSMDDVSPPKWHLAHTTWFFETFVLEAFLPGYKVFDPSFRVLFNSYYESVGDQHPRNERGFLSRPSTEKIFEYRRHVDRAVVELWATNGKPEIRSELERRLVLGIHHEQQHQELILMDIKHNFFKNPLWPIYKPAETVGIAHELQPMKWSRFEGGLATIGAEGTGLAADGGFAYDNEFPRHQVQLGDFEISNRLVTCSEWMEFIDAGGYEDPSFWLSDGFATVKAKGWKSPLYWQKEGGQWLLFTVGGIRPIRENDPVCHVSFYEADAYARFRGARLPREEEWERAADGIEVKGELLESEAWQPTPAKTSELTQIFGSVWEHTASPYTPYPSYKAPEGALGEYNGKFMCNQMVSRGGSVFTPASHIRKSYRNFFYPHQRWACQGVRLAK